MCLLKERSTEGNSIKYCVPITWYQDWAAEIYLKIKFRWRQVVLLLCHAFFTETDGFSALLEQPEEIGTAMWHLGVGESKS